MRRETEEIGDANPDVKPDAIIAGDIVSLKSGGPKMTVVKAVKGTDKDGDTDLWVIHCKWFSEVPGAHPACACFYAHEVTK